MLKHVKLTPILWWIVEKIKDFGKFSKYTLLTEVDIYNLKCPDISRTNSRLIQAVTSSVNTIGIRYDI